MSIWSFFKKESKRSAAGSVVSYNKLGQPVWTERDYESFSREAYQRNVVAYRCISMVAQSIASLDFQVFVGDKLVDNHPMLSLIERPNPMQSGSEFFEAVTAYHMIAGNSYVEAAYPGNSMQPKKTPPTFLYTLRPDRMQIIAGQNGMPGSYKYTVGGQSVSYPVARTGLSNILHVKSFNPTNDWYGMADTEAAAYSVDQHNESSAWNQALLQNSAVPSSALVGKESMEDEQYNRLKEMIDDRYASPKNAGRPMLLEGGLEWKVLGTTPKDMDWLEGQREAARGIALGYGIPPMLLGIPGDNTYSNQREARLAFWEQTVIPLANKLMDCFNYWLSPRYGDNVTLTYDLESITALGLRRQLQRESLESSSFYTVNEKRKAMGLEPVDGGDDLFIDSNKLPLSLAGEPMQKSADQLYIESLKEVGFSHEEIKKMLYREDDPEENKDISRLLELLEDGR
jgi:HK97 family phage portal protein